MMATKRARPTDARLARRMHRSYVRVNWQEVCDADVSTAEGDSERSWLLDPVVFRDQVVPFIATTNPTTVPAHRLNLTEFEEQLVPLRAVCRTWYKMAGYLLAEAKKQQRIVTVLRADSNELKRFVREAQRDGSTISDLTINTEDRYNLLLKQWWMEMIPCYPNVVRLDVPELEFGDVGRVITALSQHMPQLQVLNFHTIQHFDVPINKRVILDEIVQALRKWHSVNGGLKVIPMPLWIMRESDLYNDYLEAITAYCPRLQRLPVDSYCYPIPPVYAHEVSKDIWAAFCRGCTNLREYSPLVGPVTSEFVREFLVQPKIDLEELHFETTWASRWAESSDLRLLEDLIKMAPKLESVTLECSQDRDTGRLFSTESINNLVTSVGTHCRHLRELTIKLPLQITAEAMLTTAAIESLLHGSDTLHTLELANTGAIEAAMMVGLLHKLGRCQRRPTHLSLKTKEPLHASAYVTLRFLASDFHMNHSMTIELSKSGMFKPDRSKMVESGQRCPVDPDELIWLVSAIRSRHVFCYIEVRISEYREGDELVYVIHHLEFRASTTKLRHKGDGVRFDRPDDPRHHYLTWLE